VLLSENWLLLSGNCCYRVRTVVIEWKLVVIEWKLVVIEWKLVVIEWKLLL